MKKILHVIANVVKQSHRNTLGDCFAPIKSGLAMTLCLFTSSLFSQYIFNSCALQPAFGDSLAGAVQSYDTTAISPGAGGANVTWTFSGLTLTNTQMISHYFMAPSATSCSSMYPNAGLADSATDGWIGFYNYNADSITRYGNYQNSSNYKNAWDPEKRIICPMSYGNTYTDVYNWYWGVLCPVHHFYLNRTVTYDGYGTLSIAKNTFQAARIKVFTTGIDSVICLPLTRYYVTDTLFIWYDITNGQPLLSWEYSKEVDPPNAAYTDKIVRAYSYTHLPATATGVPSVAEEESISVFPNPGNGVFVIATAVSRERSVAESHIEVYNVFGEKVYSSTQQLSKSITLNLTSQPSGIYFLQLKTAEGTATKKLIINK